MSASRRSTFFDYHGRGAALLEFAFALPVLLVITAGIYDFGSAYTFKDKLTNAVRESARIAANQPPDLASTQCVVGGTTYNAPCSVSLAMLAVQNYLSAAGITACGIGTNASSAGNFVWTYSSASSGCGANPILTVERNIQLSANGVTAFATRVTLQYPFSWDFARVSGYSGVAGSFWISTNAVMQNPW